MGTLAKPVKASTYVLCVLFTQRDYARALYTYGLQR